MRVRYVLLSALLALAVAAPAAGASPTTFTGTDTAGTTASALGAFTAAAGGVDNGSSRGSKSSGFRTITWDDVPDAFQEPRALPFDYFNATRPRGALLGTPGDSLRVSGGDGMATTHRDFGDINSSYESTDFSEFSPTHIFSPFGSTITDVAFVVPGGSAPATVKGFGAIFTNVRLANSSSIEFFDPSGASLGRFFAPTDTQGSREFLGVQFSTEKVARVRITSGTNPLGGSTDDNLGATPPVNVVALDDFAYAEPRTLAGPALIVTSPGEGSHVTDAKPAVTGTATDPYGVKSLTVDGQPVAVGAGGTWSAPVALQKGANTLTVVATNSGGASTAVTRHVTLDDQSQPSNKFTIDRLKYSKNGKAIAYVTLPGPGGVDLRMKARSPVGHLVHLVRRAPGSGRFAMKFKVPKKARRLLARKRYPATLRVVFTPNGGKSATHTIAVTIGFRSH